MEGYRPNYANENLNIKLPIFSIHGNHDPPTHNTDVINQIGMMDLLKVNNYINYFGKFCADEFTVKPIIFTKGRTKIALYGIGYRRERRFRHSFDKGKVTFEKPKDGELDEYVCILMVH